MTNRPLLGALLALLPALSLAGAAKAPDTPAGRMLTTWLEAFNSKDWARVETFFRTHTSWGDLAGTHKWFDEVGGYELLEVHSTDPTNIFFHVKALKDGAEEVGRITVNATAPFAVSELGAWNIPAGAKIDPVRLTEKSRAALVESAAKEYEKGYVFPDLGSRMADDLRKRERAGEYRAIRYGQDLARELTGNLQETSKDRHVEVRFSFVKNSAAKPARSSEEEAKWLATVNCGFEKLEHLQPNIGYLKFDFFADPKICAATAIAAMNFVADSEALIIDLRNNGGGHPDMAGFILSHLFAERTHVTDEYTRADNATTEVWTDADVPGRKFVGKPVYILTARRTFSAAEAVTFALKNQKRAIVVGEQTLGGAHRTENRRIDDHFEVRVPFARTMDPVTKTDYEGVGVEPDVKVPAAEALDTARKLAEQGIGKTRAASR